MVYVTGDTHGDFTRFSTRRFRDQEEMSYDDTMIILGDFGLWHDTSEERYWLDWLNDKPFTTVWVDGNHDNHDRLYGTEFEELEFHGGTAHRIRDNIYHLKRGNIYEFDEKTFFAFGGAKSHDVKDGILDRSDFNSDLAFKLAVDSMYHFKKMFRIAHESWWKEEMPSPDEMNFGLETLEKHGNKVNFVITHCCPQTIATFMGFNGADQETMYFNEVARKIQFDHWFFGHYHIQDDIFGKFHCRYEKIERII